MKLELTVRVSAVGGAFVSGVSGKHRDEVSGGSPVLDTRPENSGEIERHRLARRRGLELWEIGE